MSIKFKYVLECYYKWGGYRPVWIWAFDLEKVSVENSFNLCSWFDPGIAGTDRGDLWMWEHASGISISHA